MENLREKIRMKREQIDDVQRELKVRILIEHKKMLKFKQILNWISF